MPTRKTQIEAAAKMSTIESWMNINLMDVDALVKLKAEGVEFIRVDQGYIDGVAKATHEWEDKYIAAEGGWFKKVVESQRAFMERWKPSARVSLGVQIAGSAGFRRRCRRSSGDCRMRGLVRAIDGLSRFFGAIAAVLVIVLVVLMLYDVVLRYAFNAPTAWGNDINTWLMGASFVLSIAYAMSTDSHVRVDLLYDRRTRPRIRVLRPDRPHPRSSCRRSAGSRWGSVRSFHGRPTSTGERSGSGGFNPIVWPFKLILFVGFAIFTLQIVAEIIKRAASLMGRPFDDRDETERCRHGV